MHTRPADPFRDRFATKPKASSPGRRAVVREAQEVECFRLAHSAPSSVHDCKPPELHEAGVVGVKAETEPGQPLPNVAEVRDAHCCQPSCPGACTHPELVTVFDTHSGEVRHWTGKSYPVDGQQYTLVHVRDPGTHFLELGAARFILLGCHDLLLFAARGRPSMRGPMSKEKRSIP